MGGAAAVGAQLAGSAYSAYSQYQSGQWNKRANDLMAQDALARGTYMQSLSRMRGTRVVEAGKAAAAGGNVDVQSGSVMDVASGSRTMSALDSAILRHNALAEAYGYNVRGSLAEAEANNAATATIIGGASQAYGTAYRAGLGNPPNTAITNTDLTSIGGSTAYQPYGSPYTSPWPGADPLLDITFVRGS